jgi:hypothetical protein
LLPAQLGFAALGATAATLGDFLMLGVALGNIGLDTTSGKAQLLAGTALGILILPSYLLGYRAVARACAIRGQRRFLALAAIVAGCGAATHVLTGLDIHQALAAGASRRLPADAFAEPSLLVLCATLAAGACLAASLWIVIAVTDARLRLTPVRLVALANPVLWTVVLTAIAVPMGEAGHYLGPAAPNIAHFVFFMVSRYAVRLGNPLR